MQNKKHPIIKSVLGTFSLILIDQLVKYNIRSMGGFHICNKGMAFGINIIPGFYYILAIIAVIYLSVLLFRRNLKFKISNFIDFSSFYAQLRITNYNSIPVLLIFSGAISNVTDRMIFGCVIDYIDIKFWPVFNLADVYISLGAIMLIIRTAKASDN